MKSRKINFFDPLYDFVTFEEAASSHRPLAFMDVGFAHKEANSYGESISPFKAAKAIIPFLSTLEFSRQAFLRQSNLAFLVFPSATHTRLAHSIGSCYLGFVASQRISVGTKGLNGSIRTPEYLSLFLERNGLREEFYLALLLHDVGHFPFSHALESNIEFWEAFGEEIHHEEAACELIQGRGRFFEASKRRVRGISGKRNRGYRHLAELFVNNTEIDTDAVCYFISGNEAKYIHKRKPRQQVKLRVVHELVSGLLDLDRVDHYRRDNYHTGLRAGTSLNYPSLLSGLTIYYDPEAPNHNLKTRNADPRRDLELRLAPSAIGPAISLLQTRERLTQECFEHPDCTAYEVMLHHAVTMYVYGTDFYESTSVESRDANCVFDLLASTDEQLLLQMSQSDKKEVREVVFRIFNRNPYRAVAKLSFPPEHQKPLRYIREQIADLAKIKKSQVILRASKRFGARDLRKRPGEWLDLERLLNAEGKRLVDGKYQRQIEHFKQAQETRDFIWVFAPDDNKATKIRSVLHKVYKAIDCCEEEL